MALFDRDPSLRISKTPRATALVTGQAAGQAAAAPSGAAVVVVVLVLLGVVALR